MCAAWLWTMLATVQATELYHTNRTFTPVTINVQGNPPLVYQLYTETGKFTDIVKGTNITINTNETCAIEKQVALPVCYGSAEDAWNAALAYNGTTSNYPGKTFDNVGWVRGTKLYMGKWGAYLWTLQNRIVFRSSETNWWKMTANGVPVAITNVMVGSLGYYPPMTDVVDVGPHLDAATNNFPGANQSESKEFRVDISNVFYQLSIPDIWITPRYAARCVGGSNVQYAVTGTNIPQGVTWTIIPSGLGATIQTNADWHNAEVTPGNVATNYKVRATSKDNTNFYDQVDLTVCKVDIVESNIYIVVINTTTLHLTADSSANVQWEFAPPVPGGAFIIGSPFGTSVVLNAGSVPTNYTVRASAFDLTTCYDTCTVVVLKVELEKCDPSFLPQGGANDNTTTIRAMVLPSTVKGKFKFTLFDVSDEKGYCMNAPWSWLDWGEDSDTWKDYQFPRQNGFTISGADSNIAETVTSDLPEATVTIKSYDYGSFGKIKSEFTTQDGSFTRLATEANGTNQYTKLPADGNNNDIADAWSGDTGPGSSQGAIDDLDNSPAGDGVPGDHLSRYQEYRGFIVQGAHVRTDPVQKDVFCRNHNIPAAGLSGWLTTENLGAPVHAIRYDEWNYDDMRRINPMTESYALDPERQTAVKVEDVEDWRGVLGSTLSELWGAAGFPTNELSVPNNLIFCVIDVAQIRTNGTGLTWAITPSTNTIEVFSTDGYQTNGGAIKIDDEIILYSSKTNNAFIGCTRGAMGTTAASHDSGTDVMNFANADEVIQMVFGHEAGHVVGLEDFYGPDNNHIMNGRLGAGAYLNNGYWSTYAPALPGRFRVKP